jgi:hypothetical protein
MKNNENSLTKNYRYVNAPRDKTVKATRLKILDCIGKCISELLKKTAAQWKAWFPSYIDSKKAHFSATAR